MERLKVDNQTAVPGDVGRYVVKTMPTKTADGDTRSRNLLIEIPGTVVSMIVGAFLGLMVGGNGLGFVSFVLLCSCMACVVWVRRKQSLIATVGICGLMIILWWPIGLIVREVGRDL